MEKYAGIQKMMETFGVYKHLGIELASLDREKCVLRCKTGPQHTNLLGMLHGAVAFAMMDTATGMCCVPHCEGEAGSATAEIKVNYVRPQKADGSTITCEARMLKLGQRIGVAEAKVFNEKGDLIAVSLGSVSRKSVMGK